MISFDGIQFFKDFHIRYTLSSPNVSRGWAGTACPFCNDHSDHLGLHIQTGALSCWKCGGHSALDYVKLALRIPASEAKSIYSRYLTKKMHSNERDVSVHPSVIELPPPVFTSAETNYMNRREITPYHQTTYDLRGGGRFGEWAYRIVIPVYYNNCIVSATGRTIAEGVTPKYYTLPKSMSIMNLKHVFLGMDLVPGNTVAVVEGPIDAIKGGPGFIASFGANLTDEQLLLLLEYDTIYFIKDSDEAGENFTKECYKLSVLGAKYLEIVTLDGFKDVGAMDEKSIQDVRKELKL
jgi:hypothetical protein